MEKIGGGTGADHSRCPLSAYAESLDMSDGRHDPRGGEKRSRLSMSPTGKRLISSPEYRVRSRYVAKHNKFLVVCTYRGDGPPRCLSLVSDCSAKDF